MTFADLTAEQRSTLLGAAVLHALGQETWIGRDVADLAAGLAAELSPDQARLLAEDVEYDMVNVSPDQWAAQWEQALSALRLRAYGPTSRDEGSS